MTHDTIFPKNLFSPGGVAFDRCRSRFLCFPAFLRSCDARALGVLVLLRGRAKQEQSRRQHCNEQAGPFPQVHPSPPLSLAEKVRSLPAKGRIAFLKDRSVGWRSQVVSQKKN